MARPPTIDSFKAGVPLRCISISTRELGPIPQDSPEEEQTRGWERARDDFLQRASAYFPSLRYLALATPNRITTRTAYPGDDTPVWTWWGVHRDSAGDPVEIREIPVWEGRRVREFLREADAEAVEGLDRDACRSFRGERERRV